MHPVLEITALGVSVRSHLFALILAVLVCHLLGPRWAGRLEGLNPRTTRWTLVLVGIAAFVGGRAHFVASHWSMFAGRPYRMLEFWAGLHAGAAIAAAVAAAVIVLPRYGIPLLKCGDAIVPTVGVGIAIARIGCFLEGCCYGTVCHFPWCLAFPSDAFVFQAHRTAGLIPADAFSSSAPVHPLQLYFALAGVLATVAALVVHARKAYDGQPTLVFLLVFSVTTTILEALRGEHPGRVYWGSMPQLAWIGLALTLAAAAILAAAERAHGRARLLPDGARQQGRDGDGQRPVKDEAV